MLTQNDEVMRLLSAGDEAYEVQLGGQPVGGAGGLLGAAALVKELLHGNPGGARRGRFSLEMTVELVEGPHGDAIRIVSQDFLDFCPDHSTKKQALMLVDGEPMVDRRAAPRPNGTTPPAESRVGARGGRSLRPVQRAKRAVAKSVLPFTRPTGNSVAVLFAFLLSAATTLPAVLDLAAATLDLVA